MFEPSRRSFLVGAATACLGSRTPAAPAADTVAAAGGLRPLDPPMSSLLPNTRYFEIDSQLARARYAVWVTVPAGYERSASTQFPVVYLPDGNSAAPAFIPRHPYLQVDPINPVRPFIMVCVGYPPSDAPNALAVRARDLLPPLEPLPPGLEAAMGATVAAGVLSVGGAELYLHNLRDPAGDRFLSFLTDELHPQIAAAYRVDTASGAGLFGYSYGGLFAVYAALSRTLLFRRIGAGSPGILAGKSRVFEMYRDAHARHTDFSKRLLHVTLSERELTVPSSYQPLVAAGTAELIILAGTQPLPGLSFSSALIPGESHITGNGPSFASFLRTAYGAGTSDQHG